MLKASALYIVIIISLVIAVLCSSLIVTAYYYRAEYQKKFRYDQLQNNLSSAINILLTTPDSVYRNEKTFSLFNQDNDSVSLQKTNWGVFDVGVTKAFIQKDTLYKTFFIAHTIDSSKWAALYIADEDRPVSLSGTTMIRGNAYLPKAGVQQAYINNLAYKGDKRLVIGNKYLSTKLLSPLDSKTISRFSDCFKLQGDSLIPKDSISRSFLKPIKIIDFKKQVVELKNTTIAGNVMLCSDTTVTIDSTATLDNVLVFARSVIVKNGFHGKCQLFATDSISVGKRSDFEYPSCLGIVRSEQPRVNSQAKITLKDSSVFNGLIFTYEKKETDMKPLVTIGKRDTVKGQIYSQGVLELKDKAVINGGVFTKRFLYRTSFTLYENYLINVTLDSKALSPYYLTSEMVPVSAKKKKILQWIEKN